MHDRVTLYVILNLFTGCRWDGGGRGGGCQIQRIKGSERVLSTKDAVQTTIKKALNFNHGTILNFVNLKNVVIKFIFCAFS